MRLFRVNYLGIVLVFLVFSSLLLVGMVNVSGSSFQESNYMGIWSGSLNFRHTYNHGELRQGDEYTPAQKRTYAYVIRLRINVIENGSFSGQAHLEVTESSYVVFDPDFVSTTFTISPAEFTTAVRGTIWPKTDASPPHISWEYVLPISLQGTGNVVFKDGSTDFFTLSCSLPRSAEYFEQEDGKTLILSWTTHDDGGAENWTVDQTLEGKIMLDSSQLAPAKVSNVQGDVKIWRNLEGLPLIPSNFIPLESDMNIYSGDIIQTGTAGTTALSLPDGSELKLSADTLFEFAERLEDKALEIIFLRGKIWLSVKSITEALGYGYERDKFEFKTFWWAGGAVRGTEFTVEVAEDNATKLIVLEGSVDFWDSSQVKNVTVGQNQISTCQPGGFPSDPISLDPSQIQRWWEQIIPEHPNTFVFFSIFLTFVTGVIIFFRRRFKRATTP